MASNPQPPEPVDAGLIDARPVDAGPVDARPVDAVGGNLPGVLATLVALSRSYGSDPR